MRYYIDKPVLKSSSDCWGQGREVANWVRRHNRVGFEGEKAIQRFVDEACQFISHINESFSSGCRLAVSHSRLTYDHKVEICAVSCGRRALVARFRINRVSEYISDKEGGDA